MTAFSVFESYVVADGLLNPITGTTVGVSTLGGMMVRLSSTIRPVGNSTVSVTTAVAVPCGTRDPYKKVIQDLYSAPV
jgi:hypothetical protein